MWNSRSVLEVVEVVGADLAALGPQVTRIHERPDRPRAGDEEGIGEPLPARGGVVDRGQGIPQLGDRQTRAHPTLGGGVRHLRLDDDEHAAAVVVGKDDALLAAVGAVRRRQIQAVDERQREPVVEVIQQLPLEARAGEREAVQAGLPVRQLVIAVRKRGVAAGRRVVAVDQRLVHAVRARRSDPRVAQRGVERAP